MLPASSGPTARQAITVSGPTQTRVANLIGVVLAAALYSWILYGGVSEIIHPMPAAALAYGEIVAALATVYLLFRTWRTGVRFDDRGIAVRNVFRTRRFAWPEIVCLADGGALHKYNYGEHYYWTLKVMLHDGGSVTTPWMSNKRLRLADPAMLDELKLAADRFGIPAYLTGAPAIDAVQPEPP